MWNTDNKKHKTMTCFHVHVYVLKSFKKTNNNNKKTHNKNSTAKKKTSHQNVFVSVKDKLNLTVM